jgi:hypothetical protein
MAEETKDGVTGDSGDKPPKKSKKKIKLPKISFALLFGKLMKFIMFLIILGMIFFVGMFIFNVWSSGVGSTMTEEGLVALDGVGAPIKSGVFDFWKFFKNPSSAADQWKWGSEVIENEEYEFLGVKIIKFRESKDKFFSNEPVQVSGVVEGAGLLEEGMEIRFSCSLKDYHGPIEIYPESYTIYGKGVTRRQEVSCIFPDGFSTMKDEHSETATLKAEYDFKTDSFYRIYFMDSNLLESFFIKGEDPFMNDQIQVTNELLIKPHNVMMSQVTEGPVDLRLSSESSQPFSEKSEFILFNVELITKEFGNLKRVNDLKLYVPSAIEFSQDVRLCDFEDTGDFEDGFRIYKIRNSSLNNKVNVDCSNNDFYSHKGDCIEEFNDISLQCIFNVLDLPEGNNFFFSLIKASVDYVYEAEKKEVVTVVKNEISDACEEFKTGEDCISAQGCMPNYGGDEFISCKSCPSSWISCESYDTNENCIDDVCGFGLCFFEDDVCSAD